MESSDDSYQPKKLPRGSVSLQFAGDLIIARAENELASGLFRRFEYLFETLASLNKIERILCYKLVNALMLTSYAKKSKDAEEKRQLFTYKNELFASISNDNSYRKILEHRYLVSKNFRVVKYCQACTASNTLQKLNKLRWKHCKICDIDRNFFNIVSATYTHQLGKITVFLSHDQMHTLTFGKPKRRGHLGDAKEEGRFGKFQYNAKNLDAVQLDSVLAMYKRYVHH